MTPSTLQIVVNTNRNIGSEWLSAQSNKIIPLTNTWHLVKYGKEKNHQKIGSFVNCVNISQL